MPDKITSSPLATAMLVAGLVLGSAAAESAAAPVVLDRTASIPTVSSLFAIDEGGRLVVEDKIFDDVVLADVGDIICSLFPEFCDEGDSGCDGQICPV